MCALFRTQDLWDLVNDRCNKLVGPKEIQTLLNSGKMYWKILETKIKKHSMQSKSKKSKES